ncbi:hypothetical protein [Streptomyces sp. NPDC052496]|uniref:hypothetical protein n=1 Tax=Streptomyces sp. NPDC052496 TaxID=3154951 RepID=UPI0034452F5C
MRSLNVALVRCVGDPPAVMLETWESWLLAMQVHPARSRPGLRALAGAQRSFAPDAKDRCRYRVS